MNFVSCSVVLVPGVYADVISPTFPARLGITLMVLAFVCFSRYFIGIPAASEMTSLSLFRLRSSSTFPILSGFIARNIVSEASAAFLLFVVVFTPSFLIFSSFSFTGSAAVMFSGLIVSVFTSPSMKELPRFPQPIMLIFMFSLLICVWVNKFARQIISWKVKIEGF